MFIKKSLTIIVFLLIAFAASKTEAQTTTTFAAGLQRPSKIIYSGRYGVFFVSEAGAPMTVNNGRISIVNQNGSVTTLIDGLPSGLAPPNNDLAGPSAMWLDGNSLYIAISTGDATINGPAPGSEIPNPNPSSPIFSSILELRLPPFGRIGQRAYQLSPADHTRLANGEVINFGYFQNRSTLRLTGDFPDYTPNPRPDVPNNVRPSNPFGLVGYGNKLYVTDAAQNQIRTVNLTDGATGIFFNYPPRPNPSAPPPFIDAVPDSLRLFGNKLLVTLLTGFPFPAGMADVRQIDLETGEESQFIGGLSSAIDSLPVNSGFCSSIYTLEFSTNMLMGAPGRLQRFDSMGGMPTLISGSLITPTSMARNPANGDLLITEIGTGRIMRVSNP